VNRAKRLLSKQRATIASDSARALSPSNPAATARGRALLALREMLLRGELPPGKRIEEIELGRRLGVSRPILAFLLEHVSSEGLIEATDSGGYAPRHFTLEDIRDAILARSTLEGLAASLAAKRIQDPSELEPARKLNEQLYQAIQSYLHRPPTAEELNRFGEINAALHDAIVSLARSPMLSWCIQRVQSLAFASPAAVVLSTGGASPRQVCEEHEAILKAIQAGDSAQADALIRKHAGLPIQAIEAALDGRPYASRNIALELVGKKPLKPPPSSPGGPARKENAAGATAERIVEAAADLFCEKGFYAATTRELAARLNVHQASLYHHIRNKEQLLHRICQNVMEAFLADLPEALNKAKAGEVRISAFIEAHLKVMLQKPNCTLAMVTEFRALSRPHFAEISRKYKEYSRLLELELNSAQIRGFLRTDIPLKLIRLALLNVLNWTPRWFRPSGALSSSDLISIYSSVFWDGVIDPRLTTIPDVPPIPDASRRQRTRDLHRGTLGKFIRAAAELFSKYGYESTSTRDLASLLGVEKATLYYHVQGKEDLLYAICKYSIDQLAGDVGAAMERIGDPLAQLQIGIQVHLISLLRDQTQHATSLAEARALSPERLAEIVSMRKAYQARMRAVIEAGQKAGSIRTDVAPKYLGLALEGLLDRTIVWYRRSGEFSPAQIGSTLCSLFLLGARRRS
jgi:AcrR family transcriptional regulator/DNA-binding GntR family transcriptional regulator